SAQAAVTRPTSESPGPIGPAVAGDDRNDRKWECCRGFDGRGKVRPTPRDCQVLPRILMAKIEDRATRSKVAASAPNDDIGEKMRLRLFRSQVLLRQAEQRAFDLFLQNLVKGTSHLSLGQEAGAAGFAFALKPRGLSVWHLR